MDLHIFFYKKLKEEKYYMNKNYSFYIPTIFCIISEFPFYYSYYKLSQRISYLFNQNNIKIPLEVILYNIVKLTPSPLNAKIYINLNINLKEKNDKISKEINAIPEEDDDEINDNNNSFHISGINNDNNNNFLKSVKVEDNRKMNINEKKSIDLNDKKVKNKMSADIKTSYGLKENIQNIFKKIKSEILEDESKKKKIRKIRDDKLAKKIKFNYLTCYPLIQYNLAKVLLQTLSPTDVIIIFFYTFLEKDVIFFSKDLEFLSLTINSYLNLNFPLNDEKYYFNNVTVSYDNYINQNSSFVGSTFTTIIGINDSYNPK